MGVSVRVPSYLSAFAEGKTCLEMNSASGSVGQLLDSLWRSYPALRDRIVDEQGEVRQHINIFVGSECIRFADGLSTAVPDGAEVLIVPAVSGG